MAGYARGWGRLCGGGGSPLRRGVEIAAVTCPKRLENQPRTTVPRGRLSRTRWLSSHRTKLFAPDEVGSAGYQRRLRLKQGTLRCLRPAAMSANAAASPRKEVQARSSITRPG